ncbi:sugar phosphate isomerase/epimerase [Acidilobus sp. SCGC AC-742_E15]|jgi:sugar phosphate isomerase/epimerase|nr:sugar phosphate isomerase/epimerase [Acidilobus sp. SCGC AC-742_E15]
MKIGFPNHPRKNLLKEIEWIGKNDFDFVDLFLEEDRATPEKVNVSKTRKLLEKYDLGVIGHTAWYMPIGSPVKTLRDAAVSELKRYFEIFAELGVKYVNIHVNWPGGLFSDKEGVKFQIETLKKLVKEAKGFGINLMLEPLDTRFDTVKNISSILMAVPDLYLHLDIGHTSLHGRKPEDFIRKFHDRLKHVHLHDNNKSRDLHLPPGVGSIEWEKILKVLKRYYDGTITLEVFSRDRDYVLLARDKLRIMWDKL